MQRGTRQALVIFTIAGLGALAFLGWNWQHTRHVRNGVAGVSEAADILAPMIPPTTDDPTHVGGTGINVKEKTDEVCGALVPGADVSLVAYPIILRYSRDYEPELVDLASTYWAEGEKNGQPLIDYCQNR